MGETRYEPSSEAYKGKESSKGHKTTGGQLKYICSRQPPRRKCQDTDDPQMPSATKIDSDKEKNTLRDKGWCYNTDRDFFRTITSHCKDKFTAIDSARCQ